MKRLYRPVVAWLSGRFRRKRFVLFESSVARLPKPVTVLDVGGTQAFWEQIGFAGKDNVQVVTLNVYQETTSHSNITSVLGDARDMATFRDKQFDVAFSNSVIEHVGDYAQQRRMAQEIQRVAKRYFVQTPNRYFPIEPHFLIPLFQFFPMRVRAFLLNHFDVGCYRREPDARKALEAVRAVRLLTQRELKELFPGASIHKERFLGLTKSFVVYDGWA
jgi:hypothetical protein